MASNSSLTISPDLWRDSCLSSESTLHQLSPYIGKMKSTMARTLIETYSNPGDMVCDSFVGSGVVAFESLIANRGIFASDISPYSMTLTRGKLAFPPTIEEALTKTEYYVNKMTPLCFLVKHGVKSTARFFERDRKRV